MDWAEKGIQEAKAVRARLETMSPSAGRRDFAGIINALVADAAGRELPGLAAIEGVRKQQRLAARSPASHNRSHEPALHAGLGVGAAIVGCGWQTGVRSAHHAGPLAQRRAAGGHRGAVPAG